MFKVLFLTPYAPCPPNSGASVRRFQLVKKLGKDHAVTVVSFAFYKSELPFEKKLSKHCLQAFFVRNSLWSRFYRELPYFVRPLRSLRMQRLLEKLEKNRFDIVIIDSIYMAQYYDCFPNSYKVLFEHNIESSLLERELLLESKNLGKRVFEKKQRDVAAVKRYEDNNWPRFPLRIVVSEHDKLELDSRCKIGKTIVAKNGIDTADILPVYSESTHKILFMGKLSYFPNSDAVNYFIKQILPLVLEQEPSAQFCIAGSEPKQELLELSAKHDIEIIANPKDMSLVAKECSFTIVPLRSGSGTRIKILHSMAMGLPVVSTSIGAEGLDVEDGVNILLRDQPEDFAQAVLALKKDPELRQLLSREGRHFVEKEHDWGNIYSRMEDEICQVLDMQKRSNSKRAK